MLNFIKKFYPFIFFVIIVVLSVLLFQSYSAIKRERENREYQAKQDAQNMSALKDSIKVEFNKKLKAWEYSKDNIIVQKLTDLEKYNKDLSDELKKVKGDVIGVIDTRLQGNLGKVTATTGLKIIDPITYYYGLEFSSNLKDDGFEQKLHGLSKFHVIPDEKTKTWSIAPEPTIIDTNFIAINATYGFKEFDNKYQVFANIKSNKIKITGLEGGIILDKMPCPPQPKIKKWGFGPYLGYGISTASNLGTPRFGWSIGFSAHYDIIQWRFGKK